MVNYDNPLIVQSDRTVLLETAAPRAADARASLARFAELERSPEHVHTYRISSLSLWNAAAAGLTPEDVGTALTDFAKYPVPPSLLVDVRDEMGRFGRLRVVRDFDSGGLALTTDEPALLVEVAHDKAVAALLGDRLDGNRYAVRLGDRGLLKQALLKLGWPAADEAGFTPGAALELGLECELRGYQADALSAWWADGSPAGGSGVLVLPCGAGKTVIGLGAIAAAQTKTLILATSVSAVKQWVREIIDKTTLTDEDVGEYSGGSKQIRPVTVATYQVMTHRDPKVDDGAPLHERFPHLGLFNDQEWGLVVYDEVHLLPAPVFRATAQIQAIRRLGLTATLIREDGAASDVFSLIGPKRHDAPWRELEALGWIAPAVCTEIRVELADDERLPYATAARQAKYRLSSTSRSKLAVVDNIIERHPDDRILVIGQYLDQLDEVAEHLSAPLVTGRTGQAERDERFEAFRNGSLRRLVVSKVANFSIDLPEANVAIQLSGTFGSRQEEAQRLGRLLRPKADGGQAWFYSVVTRDTVDQTFAANRQRFLTEQGYTYRILDAGVPLPD